MVGTCPPIFICRSVADDSLCEDKEAIAGDSVGFGARLKSQSRAVLRFRS
jgi:hypothetical protein